MHSVYNTASAFRYWQGPQTIAIHGTAMMSMTWTNFAASFTRDWKSLCMPSIRADSTPFPSGSSAWHSSLSVSLRCKLPCPDRVTEKALDTPLLRGDFPLLESLSCEEGRACCLSVVEPAGMRHEITQSQHARNAPATVQLWQCMTRYCNGARGHAQAIHTAFTKSLYLTLI